MSNAENPPVWHIGRWHTLAWIETIIKLTVIAGALLGLFAGLDSGAAFGVPGGARLVQLIILAVLSLGLTAAIFDRLARREIIAIVFVIFNNIAHWGMVAVMLFPRTVLPDWPSVLAGGMLLGDLVKLVWLRTSDPNVPDAPPAVLYGLTGFYIVGYLAFLLAGLLA